MKSFSDIFKNYIEIKRLPASINESIINSTFIDTKNRSMRIEADCQETVKRDDIFLAEDMIKKLYLQYCTIVK